jgi:hypothetical protein
VHPDAGFEDGARIRISTAHGSLVCQIEHDSSIRPDTLDLAPELQAQGSVLSPKDGADAQMGAPTLDGIPCKLQTV